MDLLEKISGLSVAKRKLLAHQLGFEIVSGPGNQIYVIVEGKEEDFKDKAASYLSGLTHHYQGDLRLIYTEQIPYNANGDIDLEKLNITAPINGNSSLSPSAHIINRNGGEPELIPAGLRDDYPLSSAQKSLWILSRFEGGSVAYNVPEVYEFKGSIDLERLENCFTRLIERHEILRTVFKENEDGHVYQYIQAAGDISFEIEQTDLSRETDQKESLRQHLRQIAGRKFHFEEGPLFCAALFRLNDTASVFTIVIHHIICDAWSLNIMISELLALYNSDAVLPGLRIQYKDYAVYQQALLAGDKAAPHRAYWLNQFKTRVPALELPFSKPRPKLKTYNGAEIHLAIDDEITKGFNRLVYKEKGTLFIGMLSLVTAMLYRYTGQNRLVLGSPVSGRNHAELENQIGFYVNTIALKFDFDEAITFKGLFEHVKKVTLDAFEHDSYPFDSLVEELALKRDLSRSPLFDMLVMFTSTKTEEENKNKGHELQVSNYKEAEYLTSKFDIICKVFETNGSVSLTFLYNTDLFDAVSMERFAGHLVQMMTHVSADAGQAIAHLDILSPDEQQQLVSRLDRTAVAYPEGSSVVHLFEAQVLSTPTHKALVFEGDTLSYEELNRLANQFARYLQHTYHVDSGDKVGLMLEKSNRMMVALLGILKCGACYIPVDKNYPEDRIKYIVKDSQPRIMVDDADYSAFFEKRNEYADANLNVLIASGQLAYIIYTSGTTGYPKGVMVEHQNVVRLFKNEADLFHFNEKDVWTMFHSHCFDFSVWEIFGALLFGGKLVIVPDHIAREPKEYLNLVINHQVTVLNQTPTAFNNLQHEVWENKISGFKLRYIIFGGEMLKPAVLERWHATFPAMKLINMYGITETTVHVTYKEITHTEIRKGTSNIGVPIPTLSCYVMNNNTLVPYGVPGELFVGGAGVARGYLNREKLTKERFIDHPFKQGERLYRTGDQVILLENGEMEYLGRLDNQVKIRGYRIELGEIENTLLKHEFIESAIVIARTINEEDKQLVAYIICNETVEADELKDFLKQSLPSYMLPSYFISLDEFPLTVNGKIDKNALPDPSEGVLKKDSGHYAATNNTEEKIVKAWCEVLNIPENTLSIKDNLFEIGGDSIIAIKIINKLQKVFDEIFQLATLFEYPTPELFAQYIAAKNALSSFKEIGHAELETFRSSIEPVNSKQPEGKLEKAVFILAPPRSGSTLLRVILAGNDQLFSPPELELAGFETMSDRKTRLSGKFEFLKEGLTRTIMELEGIAVEEAKSIVSDKERDRQLTYEVYQWIQGKLKGRILVDKTPSYAYSLSFLQAIQRQCPDAVFIHLVRNPQSTLLSYMEAKMDQIYRYKTPFNALETGELEWLNCHDNILNFKNGLRPEQYIQVNYESLVKDPETTVRQLCHRIGVVYQDKMIDVYGDKKVKMVDGIHKESKMIGDVKFLTQHQKIDTDSIERWREKGMYKLSSMTKDMAYRLGYTAPQIGVTIPQIATADSYDLSSAQKRIWLLSQFKGGNQAYNMPGIYIIGGDLDHKVLESAFQKIIDRHEILRTVYRSNSEGEIKQVVIPVSEAEFNLKMMDYRNLTVEDLQHHIQSSLEETFDLQHDLMIRGTVFHIAENKYVMLYVIHHIAGDGWSMGILKRELFQYYNSLKRNATSELPVLTIQYKDYTAWQLNLVQSKSYEEHRNYWLEKFSGEIPVLDMPTEKSRPAEKTYAGAVAGIQFNGKESGLLKDLAKSKEMTLFAALVGLVKMLLYRYTDQADLIVGSPIAGRDSEELENQVGFYVNTLALRTRFNTGMTIGNMLEEVKQTVWEAYAHQSFPFDELVKDLHLKRDLSRNALYDVLVVLQNAGSSMNGKSDDMPEGLTISEYGSGEIVTSKFDLSFYFREVNNELKLDLEYNTDLYSSTRIHSMLNDLKCLAGALSGNLHKTVADVCDGLQMYKRGAIYLNSTFVAEPIEPTLRLLGNKLPDHPHIHFAPYNQVVQNITNPNSSFYSGQGLFNVLFIRWQDAYRYQAKDLDFERKKASLCEFKEFLLSGLLNNTHSATGRNMIVLCPEIPGKEDLQMTELVTDLSSAFTREIRDKLKNTTVLHAGELDSRYAVADMYDAVSDDLSGIPYTDQMYTSLGIHLMKHYYMHRSEIRPKVIVVDCDNTLWSGVLGEDGEAGVILKHEHVLFQQQLKALKNKGFLLAICSKNNEQEVLDFFQNKEMPLSLEDFVSYKINWERKSENIRGIAEELNLSTDSFVFLDDSQVECAEVRENCPDVLVLEIPENAREHADFISNLWCFGNTHTTQEDANRTQMYKENAQRSREMKGIKSYTKFMEQLKVVIDIRELAPEHVERVAQLTQRTNQFNTNKKIRSADEVHAYNTTPGHKIYTVNVSDRFGDYGLVGVLFLAIGYELTIEGLLLSCRAMGRGVEYEMLRKAGAEAQQRNITQVRILFTKSPRNQPAEDFVAKVKALDGSDILNSSTLQNINPEEMEWHTESNNRPQQELKAEGTDDKRNTNTRSYELFLKEMASAKGSLEHVYEQAAEAAKRNVRTSQVRMPYAALSTDTEVYIGNLWKELLNEETIGRQDDFFLLGGDSIKATKILSRINRHFNTFISLDLFFKNSVLENLAVQIDFMKHYNNENKTTEGLIEIEL